MKKRILMFLLIFSLPIFIFSGLRLNVLATEPTETKEIHVDMAGDVDENGAPVFNNAVGQVEITDDPSFYGNSNQLLSTPNAGYSFSFYMENGYVLSANPKYNFRTTSNHQFVAFFRPIDKKQVLILDANKKYLGSLLVDADTTIVESDLERFVAKLTAKPNHEFSNWDIELPLVVQKDLTTIHAVYKPTVTETFDVNVYGDGEGLLESKNVAYGQTVTVSAPDVAEKFFSHWEVDGQIMSYKNPHTFSVYGAVNVKAVYSAEQVNQVSNIYLNKTTIMDESIIYFLSQTFVEEGYEIVEQGIIYKDSNVQLESILEIGDEGVTRSRAIRVSPNSEFAISLDTIENHLLYVRAYVFVAINDVVQPIIYSDQQLVNQFKYNINYNLNGGTNDPLNEEIYSIYGLPITLKNPSKAGSIFKGWYLSNEFAGDAITTIDVGTTGDVNLYAKWEEAVYNISYELNGGTLASPKETYKASELPVTLPIPTKDGYTFGGWYDNPELSGSAVTTIPVGATGNKAFYAKWELATYNVTYNANEGNFGFTSKEDLKMEFFRDLYTYINPVESFSDFVHGVGNTSGYSGLWFLNNNYRYKIYMKNEKGINSELNYFINQPQYNTKWVSFFDMMDALINQTNEIQFFWSMTDVGTIRLREYLAEERYQDVITTPTYEPKVTTFNINSADIYLPAPRRAGDKFVGWYDNPDFNGLALTKISSGSFGNKTLYAKWEQLTDYSITYNLDGGTLEGAINYYITNDLPIILPIPEKTQYVFLGWYLTSDFSGNPVTELGFNTTGNIALYAKWAAAEQYNISYTLNSGIWGYPDKATMIKSFFKDLYVYINPAEDFDTFVHGEGLTTGYSGLWTTKTSYADKLYTIGKKQVDDNLGVFINNSLYNVKWMPFFNLIEQLMIERNEGSTFWGSASTGRARIRDYSKNATFTEEQLARLPNFNPKVNSYNIYTNEIRLMIPNRVGYSFEGWYETTDFSTPKVTNIPTGSIGNKVYYAKWVALTSYIITYNLNGGTLSSPINNYTSDTLPIKLNTPTKTDYVFDGWYETSDFSGNKITEIRVGSTGNKVLYAKWISEVPQEIIYKYNDGILNYANKEAMVDDYITDLRTYISGEKIDDLRADNFMSITSRTGYGEKVYSFFADATYGPKWSWMKTYILSIANNENYQYKDELIAGNTTYWRANIHGFINNNKYTHPIDPKIYSIDFGNYHLANDFWYRHNGPKTYTTAQGSIDLGTPTRTGYNFIGWYENEDYTGTPLTNIPTGRSGTIILYAKWE